MKILRILILFISSFSFVLPRMLHYVRSEGIVSLDPAREWDMYTSEVLSNIYEGLVRFKENKYEVEPLLAKKWEIKDGGKRWIFYLRKGIKFHDGSIFNADSVIFSFQRQVRGGFYTFKTFFPFFKNIRKIDDYTIEITQEKPYAPFLYALANPVAFIISPNSEKGGNFIPIGTGPFKFKEWKPGNYVILEANPDYWGSKPEIEGVVFNIMEKPNWRLLQLKNGNADVVTLSSVKEYEELKSYPQTNFIIQPLLDVNYLVFNTQKAPFNKRKVREALSHIIDKRKLIRLLFEDLAIPASSPIPPYLWGFNSSIKDYNYDLAKAKKLLREAGYPEGFRCNLYLAYGRSDLKDIVIRFVRNATKIGVHIQVIFSPSYAKFVEATKKGLHNIAALGWLGDFPDPDNFLYPLFSSNREENRTFYNSVELDSILKKARVTTDRRKRLKLYLKAQEIIHKEVLWIPLFHSTLIVAYNKNIKGLRVNPKGYLLFNKVRFRK